MFFFFWVNKKYLIYFQTDILRGGEAADGGRSESGGGGIPTEVFQAGAAEGHEGVQWEGSEEGTGELVPQN